MTRTIELADFDSKAVEYVSELVQEALLELFYDERVEIQSFDWSIKVNVRYE